jgi:hypothetical protein
MPRLPLERVSRPARERAPLAAVLVGITVAFACGGERAAVTRDSDGGTTAPTVTSLTWRNRQVGLGSDRAKSFCCLDPIAYTCSVDAPDTPSVTVSLSFQDQRGACVSPQNCWAETRVLATSSGSSVVLSVLKEAPMSFAPSVLTCSAANVRGYASRPLTILMDVAKGDGP